MATPEADDSAFRDPSSLIQVQHLEWQELAALADLGIGEAPFADNAAVRLAQLRAQTGLKLPDCCVLLTAEQTGTAVASLDARLRRAAVQIGLAVVPTDD